jgi:hypothetical protein
MVNYRSSNSEVIKFFRKLPSDYPRLDWDIVEKVNYSICHWGQRKLFFSELEFLVMAAKHYDLSECVVLYVGSAPGIHTNLLIEMFPMLKWLLYDPNKFLIDKKHINSGAVELHTGDDGFYIDSTTKKVLKNPFIKDKKILFMSDIRKTTDDDNVASELVSQQRWIIELNAEMFMLKFRFPFNYNKMWEYDFSDIKDNIIYDRNVKPKEGEFFYLDGLIQTQIYAPAYSAETRLISRKNNDKYDMKIYDIKKYEEQMLYFNEVDRLKTYSYREADKMKYHLLGYDDGYESVCEYYIVRKFLKEFNKDFDCDAIIKYLYKLNKDINKNTSRNFLSCPYDTHKIYIDKIQNSKNPLDINILKKNKQKSVALLTELYKNTIKSLELQKIYFEENLKKNMVLDKKDYEEQIFDATEYLKQAESILLKL